MDVLTFVLHQWVLIIQPLTQTQTKRFTMSQDPFIILNEALLEDHGTSSLTTTQDVTNHNFLQTTIYYFIEAAITATVMTMCGVSRSSN